MSQDLCDGDDHQRNRDDRRDCRFVKENEREWVWGRLRSSFEWFIPYFIIKTSSWRWWPLLPHLIHHHPFTLSFHHFLCVFPELNCGIRTFGISLSLSSPKEHTLTYKGSCWEWERLSRQTRNPRSSQLSSHHRIIEKEDASLLINWKIFCEISFQLQTESLSPSISRRDYNKAIVSQSSA